MSDDRRKPFPFDEFEPQWQQRWLEEKTFRTPGPGDADFDASKPKYYILDMFPYPSGAGLHVGHPEGYTATDIIGRYKRMNGFNVLHPMGWDAFGLPAEQYAIKTGQHPRITTEANIANFRRQLQALGFAYDWDREVNTTDPDYVRWTQWIFLQLYASYFNAETGKAAPVTELEAQGWTPAQIDDVRLAYIHEAPVNWSPDLGTVLANEEIEEWKAKGHTVERRPLRQWMLRITKYAQRLIDELEPLDWPDSIKLLQRNWIGRSEGAEVAFTIGRAGLQPASEAPNNQSPITNTGHEVTVFTTRPDTLFGATYMVLAPEHPLVSEITSTEQKEVVEAYIKQCASKSDLDRGDLNKNKSGVPTGAFATNPVNGEQIPVWIADYVMMGYGTGAIMAVPAHDERDIEFAQKFGISIKQVVAREAISEEELATFALEQESSPAPNPIMLLAKGQGDDLDEVNHHEEDGTQYAFTERGFAVNSGFLDGLPTPDAKTRMIAWLEEHNKGTRKIQFKLRDWLFSRQRYWGEPFPLLWDKETGLHAPLPESELPLLQPEMEDFKPTGDPRGPLVNATDWINYSDQYTRETNTMPQWAGSCWYYLRYCDPRNEQRFISKEAETYWSGSSSHNNPSPITNNPSGMVDLYVGGTEHAVLHLLYARFWHKVLHDLGHLSTSEPFQRLVNQGLILGEDGQKMSKSLGNVVNPDDVVVGYGADALRLYEMFMGPLEQVKPWSMKGVEGVSRFLARVWRVAFEQNQEGEWVASSKLQGNDGVPPSTTPPSAAANSDKALLKVLHETIKKVGEDIERLSFNTAISQMMVCTNAFTAAEKLPTDLLLTFLQVLNPFAPHLTEEINKRVAAVSNRQAVLLSEQPWPAYDEQYLVQDTIELVIQVNGKVRAKLTLAPDTPKEQLEQLARDHENVQQHTTGKTIRKIIVIPGRLINIVAN